MSLGRRLALRVGWLSALCVVVAAGCSGTQSADQALDAALKNGGQQRQTVYPFAGKVTLDGQPLNLDNKSRLIVMLYDPNKPDPVVTHRAFVECASDGAFSFSSYGKDDGVPTGKYIVVIAELTFTKKKGLLGPDRLKNQYNDPDKNAQVKQFSVDHQAPGKKDYEFDLKSPSGDAAPPGPKALTQIPE